MARHFHPTLMYFFSLFEWKKSILKIVFSHKCAQFNSIFRQTAQKTWRKKRTSKHIQLLCLILINCHVCLFFSLTSVIAMHNWAHIRLWKCTYQDLCLRLLCSVCLFVCARNDDIFVCTSTNMYKANFRIANKPYICSTKNYTHSIYKRYKCLYTCTKYWLALNQRIYNR